jgi:hypothetical protein
MDEDLIRKLKLPQAGKVAVIEPPEGYLEAIGRRPADTTLEKSAKEAYDFVQLFAASVADVERLAPSALQAAKPDAFVWICYPKGTSKIKTDINRDRGWKNVYDAGWEGVALVSVDDTWSAMRFRPVGAAGARPRPAAADRRGASADPSPVPDMPDDFRQALAAQPGAAAFFDNLAPSHRKEYINWIADAKKAETRTARIEKAAEKLSQGLKRPSDKPSA